MGGFDTAHVLSAEDHYCEFVCCICQLLSNPPVTTTCGHVYCFGCIEEWTQGPTASRECPKCKSNLHENTSGTVSKSGPPVANLKDANPLAWRVLSRVKVRCPLHKQGCKWQGDYSELESHLTNSGEHEGNMTGDREQTAEANALALKDEANREFEARNFLSAIKLYNKAISVCPSLIVLWSNRATARFMLEQYELCIEDCNKVLSMDPTFSKGYLRKGHAQLRKGELNAATVTLKKGITAITGPPPPYGSPPTINERKAKDIDSLTKVLIKVESVVASVQEAESAIARRSFKAAAHSVGVAMRETTAPSILLLNARVELGLGHTGRAQSITLSVLRNDSSNVAAYCIRAEAVFVCEEFDHAVRLLKQALRMDPDSSDAKTLLKRVRSVQQRMSEAKALHSERDFETLKPLYTELLESIPETAPLYATLMAERANANYRLKLYEESLSDCAKAIYAKDDCKQAWLTKRLALHGLGRHQEALDEMQKLMSGWGQNDATVKHAHFKADFELRKSKRPDYYQYLGVQRVSTEGEIKHGYKVKALEMHPDKHAHKGPEALSKAEADFKLLSEGLEILGDPMKRQLYDEGFDKAAIDERVQAAQRAAHKEGHRH